MAVDTAQDREMMLSPYKWPLFYLPLKRRKASGGFPDVALLRSATDNPDADFTVEINMTVYGPIGEVERKVYSGVDEIIADGWVVD